MIASRGQNRVFPLARVGRVGFGPSAETEPEGKLDGCTFARASKRIRHQPECTWNQTLTDSGAPVSEAGNSGDEPGGCRTCSGMAGRNVGGTKSDDPVSHPNNDRAHRNQSPLNPVEFTQIGNDDVAALYTTIGSVSISRRVVSGIPVLVSDSNSSCFQTIPISEMSLFGPVS